MEETTKFSPDNSDTVERLAVKLYKANPFGAVPWDRLDERKRDRYRQDAKALLVALQQGTG